MQVAAYLPLFPFLFMVEISAAKRRWDEHARMRSAAPSPEDFFSLQILQTNKRWCLINTFHSTVRCTRNLSSRFAVQNANQFFQKSVLWSSTCIHGWRAQSNASCHVELDEHSCLVRSCLINLLESYQVLCSMHTMQETKAVIHLHHTLSMKSIAVFFF